MNVLVTGSSGFIGSTLVKKLIVLGHVVEGADRIKPSKVGKYKHIKIDLSNWEEYGKLGTYDAIYHIAGHSAGDLSIVNYEEDLRDNVLSTANIIRFAQNKNVKQIIYASSMAVYGDQPKYPVNEKMLPRPNVYYGANKLASEYYLKIANSKNLNTCSLRLFNIYGPNQDVDNLKQGMVSIFIGELIKNKKLEMRGSPERFRDFLYIDDAVDGLILCLNNKKVSGEVINLASGKKLTLGELVSIIQKNLPFETELFFSKPSSFDLNGMHGSISKAKKLLGFHASVPIEEGIRRTINWVLKYKGLL